MKLDVYRGTIDPMLRMAVERGHGLPPHVDAADWELMSPGTSQIIEDAMSDIEARGFCFFRLVLP
jgi:hypothetical protein